MRLRQCGGQLFAVASGPNPRNFPSVKQLQDKYFEYSQQEEKLYETHRYKIAELLERNKDRCYEIINKGDGAYFGRKTFMRLFRVVL